MKVREVIAFKNYFEAIETLERVPSNYLKHLTGTEGLMKQEFN